MATPTKTTDDDKAPAPKASGKTPDAAAQPQTALPVTAPLDERLATVRLEDRTAVERDAIAVAGSAESERAPAKRVTINPAELAKPASDEFGKPYFGADPQFRH